MEAALLIYAAWGNVAYSFMYCAYIHTCSVLSLSSGNNCCGKDILNIFAIERQTPGINSQTFYVYQIETISSFYITQNYSLTGN